MASTEHRLLQDKVKSTFSYAAISPHSTEENNQVTTTKQLLERLNSLLEVTEPMACLDSNPDLSNSKGSILAK